MNAPLNPALLEALASASLDDKYTLEKGRVYLSGVQALVRLPMLQKARDRAAGLNTAGFISGYRGSPLGGVDQALWKAKQHLAASDVVFQPGVNEDLAATAVWGSQQVNLFPGAKRDGVFSMWYGKGPGVDRSIDVLKHANSAGSSRHGGVLLLAGDDHAAKSSTVAHQSEHVLQAAGIPVLYPANVQEYLDYGLHGWAMSRYSGLWVAMKCVTDVVESTASVEIDPDRVQVVLPQDFAMPAGGLNIRWPDSPLEQEARLLDHKWYAALAYVRANRLNRVVLDSPNARFGIMTAGKAYLDVRQALADLGLDDDTCARIGIRVYKVGCVWPLEAHGAREFATGLEEILVVEEKRQILEYALKEELYNWREDVRPKVFGKFDQRGNDGGEWSVPRGDWLLPAHYELSPALIAKAIARRLERFDLPDEVRARIAARVALIEAKEREAAQPRIAVERKPWFCSGCPHNTSTRVPEGSRALAGIGCHYMTLWMDRNTETFSQMGGEGVAWTGQMHFTDDKHVFANLGDGTYFHSGLLAIRASIAARANITYKILFNDAVAMTGGQPIDGVLTVPQIAQQVLAEGAKKLVVVTDEPAKYGDGAMLPSGVAVLHRDQLDAVQLELRDTEGVTILIYDQTCATEKRRRRKRGTYPDPAKRAFINDAVCEGCGDCSAKSNCLSVEPLETELGTKRRINQSSCNKDFSCVNGFCPSFVTAEGAQVRKPAAAAGKGSGADFAALPQPRLPALERPYGVLVTGVGGTGVVTIGGLLGMASHLERKGVTVLDMAGLAQKGGAVISHVQIAPAPEHLHATRIATGEARLVIGGDAIVSASAEVLSKVRHGLTAAVVNSANTPTAEFIKNPKWKFPGASAEQDLRASVGEACAFFDASAWAVTLLADAIYSNPLLLGYAWQKGWIPLQHASLVRAIELNGVSVEKNRLAFEWGRYLAHHGEAAVRALLPNAPAAASAQVVAMPQTLDSLIRKREAMLADYQNAAYAARYRDAVARIRAAEQQLGIDRKLPLTESVARNLAKLMAYKDEYEVARLYTDPAFLDKLRAQFEGEPGRDYQLSFWLAPPLLAKADDKGRLLKRRFGPRTMTAFRLLARLKGLRGTALDVFGKTAERRAERALVSDYLALVEEFAASLSADNIDTALALAALPDDIRGYGHVKEASMAAAAMRREALLAQYRGAARRDAA
ncbi:indolepyruvate ferredoxin oxidoreductase family protein [Cupriavidus taiwanensis]|uniref:Indolepyruvate ferredoxin oxidoreductase, alpha and beta subunits PorG domain, C terminal (Pyruvate:ferredoxin oxidoreductase and related 2-oxoacid:ferredoxin oxidoreductases, gamma subunit) n=1 Tax=Cupriavidus taiwanensis (strain DSM 17343 / BCRC 17206 / CCUG 44338 / CIP 107171 / LMG 19424 / R1) TaxID=977880 RepID=B3R9A1_CUPTR|nr:indolepyruvate ferredoxin oxidoreductase family protein [Cupriavidus taiwanensis]CAQ71476.1 Indolepyruvate ferredoxin oxidoreductase, alpha and beta subunits; PorG domain, C terminal (Pyruvate:ferredoxin oxidoreductase and related 2-oxoacid:ferredoxin oxidoreductases, gamma subunit) [Cupriavidus taiwanensis LMG 19424]